MGRVKRREVQSSMIRSVGYDEKARILEVEFVSGSVYRYHGVPRELFEELLEAPSKGSYFLERIRGAYEYTRAA